MFLFRTIPRNQRSPVNYHPLCGTFQQTFFNVPWPGWNWGNADTVIPRPSWHNIIGLSTVIGRILGLLLANERRRYFVTTSLIGWDKPRNSPGYSWITQWLFAECETVKSWVIIYHITREQRPTRPYLGLFRWQVTTPDAARDVNVISFRDSEPVSSISSAILHCRRVACIPVPYLLVGLVYHL